MLLTVYGTEWPILCWCAVKKLLTRSLLLLLVVCSSSTESRGLKNIDRRSGVSMEVTVGGVTVVVTDYKLKPSPPSAASKSRMSSDSQSSHDTVTTSSPDNHVSHNAASNSVGSPVQSSEADQDWWNTCGQGSYRSRKTGKKSGKGQGEIIFWKYQGKWKVGVGRCQIFRLKCIKFDFCWGSAPDPAGELTALPQTL